MTDELPEHAMDLYSLCPDCQTDLGDEHMPGCRSAPRCPVCAMDLTCHRWSSSPKRRLLPKDKDQVALSSTLVRCEACRTGLRLVRVGDVIDTLLNRIDDLEHQVNVLKGEVEYMNETMEEKKDPVVQTIEDALAEKKMRRSKDG